MYRKSRWRLALERKRERGRKLAAAKERKRLAFDPDREGWRPVRTVLLRWWAGPDGRVAIYADGQLFRCGSERAVRAALARMIHAKSAPPTVEA